MDEIEKAKRVQQYRERFVRWQQLSLTQLSNTNNLILTFSIGFLSFAISKTDFKLPANCCAVFLSVLGYLLLIASFFTGTMVTFNRLKDFRKTKDIVRHKQKRFETKYEIKNHGDIATMDEEITRLESETKKIGDTTWYLLHWQLWTFFIGSAVTLVTLCMQNN